MNEKMNLTKTLLVLMIFTSGVLFGLYINLFFKKPEPEKIILNEEIICKDLQKIFKEANPDVKTTKQMEEEAAINRMLRN